MFGINEIDAGELNRWMAQPSTTVHVIDVREPQEYAGGSVAGAELMPLRSLPHHLAEIPRDRPVVLMCRSGARSGHACAFLTAQGFRNVYNLQGGIISWVSQGLPAALPKIA